MDQNQYQQPQYQQPQYQQPPVQDTGKGLSIAGLVLGIVAVVLAWFYMINIAALVCGIAGIVCAAMGKKKARAAGAPTGMGTAGLVVSIIGTVLAGIGFLTCTLCVICAGNAINAAADQLNKGDLNDLSNELNNLLEQLN